MGKFPIHFRQLSGLQSQDESEGIVETLSKLTPQVNDIFKELNQPERSPRHLQKELLDFFVSLEA